MFLASLRTYGKDELFKALKLVLTPLYLLLYFIGNGWVNIKVFLAGSASSIESVELSSRRDSGPAASLKLIIGDYL